MQSDCCAYLRKNRRRSKDQSLERGRHWRLSSEHGRLLSKRRLAKSWVRPASLTTQRRIYFTSGLTGSFATRCAWPHLEHECLLSKRRLAKSWVRPASLTTQRRIYFTSGLTGSFATRCAWPHLEHDCLLSHPPIGAKAVPRIICHSILKGRNIVGRPLAIVFQKQCLLSQFF